MGRTNWAAKARRAREADSEARKVQEIRSLHLGELCGVRTVKHADIKETKEVAEMREIQQLQKRVLKLLIPTSPWLPVSKPNQMLPAYVEENRAVTRSQAEKLPYPKPGKTIRYDRWKEIGGGKGT